MIDIEIYADVAITFDPNRGLFLATMDDEEITSQTLQGLRDRINTIAAKLLAAARKAQKPVPVVVLHEEKYKHFRLLPCTLLGLHAGRTASRSMRVLANGHKETLDVGYGNDLLYCLAPDDPRVIQVKDAMDRLKDAEHALKRQQDLFDVLLRTLPHVLIPEVKAKETALETEGAFLAAVEAAIDVPKHA